MRLSAISLPALLLVIATACAQQSRPATPSTPATPSPIGFDSNDYPGDDALPALRQHFAFAGYWLTIPPGAHNNGWVGKRDALLRNGFGFLILANGKTDAEISRAKHAGTTPAALGAKDAANAVAAAQPRTLPRPRHPLSRSGRRRPPQHKSIHLPSRVDRSRRPLRLSSRRLRQRPARRRRPWQNHHHHPEHPRTRRRATPPRHRLLGLSGRLPSRQRLHHAASTDLRQRHPRRRRMAVRTISSPQRAHRSLREDLRRRRQLLRPRPPELRHRSQRRYLARPLARPLIPLTLHPHSAEPKLNFACSSVTSAVPSFAAALREA